ncbi:MAG: glycosyltransferase family 39 protein [Chloroflexi bacterium]|nr:glycosyltransferase family 39 protein [Chloroflexota bacterium]
MQAPDQPQDIPPALNQPRATSPSGPSHGAARRPGQRLALALVLAGVALIALALRLNGLTWDQGHLFHPDERAILMKAGEIDFPWPPDLGRLLDPQRSPWNPHWFPYGSLVLYLLKLAGALAGLALGRPLDIDTLAVVGRVLTALLDTGLVLLVYALGARLYGRATGLLAAGLASFAVIHIQLSHFYTSDPLLTFFLAASMLFLAGLARTGRRRDAALAGLMFGLALANKVSGAPFLLAAGLASFASCFEGDSIRDVAFRRERVPRAVAAFALFLGLAAVAFLAAAPYEVLDFRTFRQDVEREGEMVRRIADFPYTRQYISTLPYLYHIQQLATWGLGWPLGLVVWAGLAAVVGMAIAARRKADLLLLAWVVPYLAVVGAFEVKFLRYMLPITPFLLIFGARAMVGFYRAVVAGRGIAYIIPRWGPRLSAQAPRIAVGIIAFVLASAALYAIAYSSVYARPHTAVQASRWVRQNIPPGAVIAKEHWEEGVPDLGGYRIIEMGLYEPDDASKRDTLAQQLAEADAVVFYSNRLYGTIPRLSDRYPMSSRYYRLLFNGDLGFELAYTATSYPDLLGVSLVDDTFGRPGLPPPAPLRDFRPSPVSVNLGYADESFTVYDHPKVMVFRKVRRMDAGTLAAALGVPSSPASRLGLVFSPAEWQVYRESGTWSALFDRQSPMNRLPEVTWLLAVQLVALLTFPLAFKVCGCLPDRGYLLAKALGILLVAYLTWLAASTRILPFERGTILLAMALVGLVSAGMAYRWRSELRTWLRQGRGLLLTEEAVFLLAFVGFYVIRVLNPDLWHAWRGGEKPMDFAYLNAVVRSVYMPPYDPWFAGGYLNYYYFGQFVTAVLIKLTGVIPSVAYNLAVPLFFALTTGAAFSIAYSLAEAFRRCARPGTARRLPSPLLAGAAGALFVAVIGNLDGGIQVAQDLWRVLVDKNPSLPFDFWRSSRMMPPTISITEFPFFTFLFADLHAHLMAMPFYLLTIGLALNVALGRNTGLGLNSETAALLLAALTIGALRVINSWDFPAFLLLVSAGAAIGEYSARRRVDAPMVGWAVLKVAMLAGLGTLFFLPFHQRFEVFYSGVVPSREQTPVHQYLAIHGLFLFLVLSYIAYELWRAARPSGSEQAAAFAGTGAALADERGAVATGPHGSWSDRLTRSGRNPASPDPFGYAQGRPAEGASDPTGPTSTASNGVSFWSPYAGVVGAAALTLFLLRYETIAFLFAALAAVTPLVVLILARPQRAEGLARSPSASLRACPESFGKLRTGSAEGTGFAEGAAPRLFLFTLVALALVLGIGVDVVTVQGDIERMNTVFKFYLQAWVLLALASAFCLWRLRVGAFLPSRPLGLPRIVWATSLAVLLAASLAYPILATPVRVRDRFLWLSLTNDGMAYMQYARHDEEGRQMELRWDYDAIRWLQDNVKGSPVILEANTPLYHWGNRVSVYTGLPAVVGWDWHQIQQRVPYERAVQERRAAVKEMYSTLNERRALDLLRQYQVEYVYVGPLERISYPEAGLRKFQRMAGEIPSAGSGQVLEVAYPGPQVTIYRVRENSRDFATRSP